MVGRSEPVTLRSSDDGWSVLTIGENFEVRLTREHVVVLRDQLATTLRDIDAGQATEQVLARVHDAGAQARTAAVRATRQAAAAADAGATDEAEATHEAARIDLAAADHAQLATARAAAPNEPEHPRH